MRRWQMFAGWAMAVAAASAVGFVAIALVGVGIDPLSGPASSATASIGALGSEDVTGSSTDQGGAAAEQLPVVTTGPAKPPAAGGSAGAPGTVNDSPGDVVAASPAPSAVSGNGTRPRASTSPSASTTITRSVSTAGGSATARCTGGRITLSAWSPAPGFSVDEVRAGPASSVEVRFESSSRQVEVKAECSNGAPRFETESRSEDGSDDD